MERMYTVYTLAQQPGYVQSRYSPLFLAPFCCSGVPSAAATAQRRRQHALSSRSPIIRAHWNASAAGVKLPSLALVWPIHLCSSRTSSGRSACRRDSPGRTQQ